jgi:hypothetical protein
MRNHIWIAAVLPAVIAGGVVAQDKDTRAGNCEDAKKQFEYFCKGNANDIMVQVPIACNNAKRNLAAACEGKVDADRKYEFNDSKK